MFRLGIIGTRSHFLGLRAVFLKNMTFEKPVSTFSGHAR